MNNAIQKFKILPDDFNLNEYKLLNKDLAHMSDKSIKLHYINYGKKDKRLYNVDNSIPKDFISDEYRDLYTDLEHMDDLKIKVHYILYGSKEKRNYKLDQILPKDFSCEEYILLNKDLSKYNLSDYETKLHYFKFSKQNKYLLNHALPTDFILADYLDLNKDLVNLNNTTLIEHYLRVGKKEKRLYNIDNNLPKDFNTNNYISYYFNYDLTSLTERELKIHYIKNGKKEKRQYKAISDDNKKYNRYPFLFSKYLLGLESRNHKIPFILNVINNMEKNLNKKKYWCHIHLSDINELSTNYFQYIKRLIQFFNVMVTYNFGIVKDKFNCVFIKINDKGGDIGGKILAVDYLAKNNINTDYILFIHSCNNLSPEDQYYLPLINNIELFLMKDNQNILGFFHDTIIDKDMYLFDNTNEISHNQFDPKFNVLQNEMCDYLQLNKNINLYPEGDNYILHKNIYKQLFNIEVYPHLNNLEPFHESHAKVLSEIYTKITKHPKLFNENTCTVSERKLIDNSFKLEECFKKLIFKLIHKAQGEIHIFENETISDSKIYKLTSIINTYLKKYSEYH